MMAKKLTQLRIDRVDLVDKGANQDAHIVLFKRDTPLAKMDTHGTPMTTQEILDHQERCEEWRELRWAFMDALDSIMEYATPEEQSALLLASVEEFAVNARAILSAMALPDDLYKRATDGVVDVEKAGRVIAGQRLQRLKQAVMALQGIIMEAEPGPDEKGKKTMAEKKDALTLDDVTKRAETAEAQVLTLREEVATLEKRQAELVAEIATLQPVDPWAGVSTEVRKRIEDSEARVAKAEAEVLKRDCIALVRKYDRLPINPDDHWELFAKVNTLPEAIAKQLYALFDAYQEMARQTAVLKTQGVKGTGNAGGSAWETIQGKAKDLVAKGLAPSVAAGVDIVIQQEPQLYAEYEAERRGV